MNYFLREAAKKTSIKALLTYAYIKDGTSFGRINVKRKTGKVNEADEENSVVIISNILSIKESQLEKNKQIEPVEYTVEQIAEMRKANNITVKEISELLGITTVQYIRYEKKKVPNGTEELIANIYLIVENKAEQTYWKHSLMYMRYNCQLTVEKAAEGIGISPEELWRYEWINQVPLNLVDKIGQIYFVDPADVPYKAKADVPHCKTLRMLRIKRRLTLTKVSLETGMGINNCAQWEKNPNRVPPMEYVNYIIGNKTAHIDTVFVNANRTASRMDERIDHDRLEYERKLNANYCNKKTEFIKLLGVTRRKYEEGKLTYWQAKEAAELLGLAEKHNDKLKEPLNENEQKILKMEINNEKIKSYRENHGVSIGKLAEAIKMPKGMISKMENGIIQCSPILLKRIAEYFNEERELFL